MKRATTSGKHHSDAQSARPGVFHGPRRQAPPPKSTAHSLCDSCGHFRSEHRDRRRCSCGCEQFTFGAPLPPKRKRRDFTEEELAKILAWLEAGWTYTEVSRKLQRSPQSLRRRFPGYGENGLDTWELNGRIAGRKAE